MLWEEVLVVEEVASVALEELEMGQAVVQAWVMVVGHSDDWLLARLLQCLKKSVTLHTSAIIMLNLLGVGLKFHR